MKKIIQWLLIVTVIVLGINVPDIQAAQRSDKKLRIAYNISAGQEDIRFSALWKNLDFLAEIVNVEFVYIDSESFGTSNEASVYYVEYAIDQNVDGILLCPSSDQVLPAICRMCEDAQVYWGIYFRSIADEEIRETCEKSPYYIGNICEDEETMGYQITKMAADMGYHNLGMISTATWNTTGQSREVGVQRAINEKKGIRIIGEAREGTSGEDIYSSVKSLITAYPDLDCVMLVASTKGEAQNNIIKAIEDSGKNTEIGVFVIDFMEGYMEAMENGILKGVAGLPQISIDPYYLSLKMINILKGYPIESGTSQTVPGIMIADEKEAEQMEQIIGNENLLFFSREFIEEKLFKWNNPDLDGEEFQKIINENVRLEYSRDGS